MKFCIGPVTKNTVDVVIDIVNNFGHEFSFIPSRRQIEYDGGYVNNWTMEEFCAYVKEKSNNKIIIERDHGGPGQGKSDDDGFHSFQEDCKYMDIIHIDPWKKYPSYSEGLEKTIELIQYCYSLNPTILYEIGTEEGIRPFSVEELDSFVSDVKVRLAPEIFQKIKYLVIQCGTRLLEQSNIGVYDENKLQEMLRVSEKYGLNAKEHNGDWISQETIQSKSSYGLRTINIAPEFGSIESTVILEEMKKNPEHFESLYQICYRSNTWKKWVSDDFIPTENKEKLITICGHYIYTHPNFVALKEKYPALDEKIKDALLNRFYELLGIYSERKECIFCSQSKTLVELYTTNLRTPICYSFFDTQKTSYFIPYNVQYCNDCRMAQLKYLGKIDLVYQVNHIDNFGKVKHNMHSHFADFIAKNEKIQNTIEIGACHDYLSRLLLNRRNDLEIYIVDPSFTGLKDGLHIIEDYLENIDLTTITCNTLIMSSVFEHFYEPKKILEILQNTKNIEYIYINHPNLDYALENNVHINLTAEHTFYIQNEMLEKLFNVHGFHLTNKNYFENHTICYEFTRNYSETSQNYLTDKSKETILFNYINRIKDKINYIHRIIEENPGLNYYLWPASMHLVPLFINGLNYTKFKGVLDNSPNKIGKFFYGYNLECFNFKEIIEKNDANNCIFLGGAPNYIKELNLESYQGKLYFI